MHTSTDITYNMNLFFPVNKTHTIESLGIKAIERPASERGTFPRYMVVADEVVHQIKTPSALRKLLNVIYAERPTVFVNAAKCITIDFDR
jgi:hypothetical protein